jgi:peptidoglycan/xylan/chitin deacetylase (PgdA/CDA1 family)
MFSNNQLQGTMLPEKVLCFTFDDGPGQTRQAGPGPKTLQLAQYLHAQGIPATFFMVGQLIKRYPHIVSAVADMGHTVGNHTFFHSKPLIKQLEEGENIVAEIEMTDQLIRDYCRDSTVYFRAPWGLWSTAVAHTLNEHIHNGLNHVGPFYWDIDSRDWAYWQNNGSPKSCATSCLRKIRRINRGIVLMHDSTADITSIRRNNQTYETVKILIPKLKDLGYTFVEIDQVPYPSEITMC